MFAIGGVLAALAGVLGRLLRLDRPGAGHVSLLIFAFIVVVIGGLGSIGGSLAAVLVGLVQQYTNYYESGVGDLPWCCWPRRCSRGPAVWPGSGCRSIDRRAPCRRAARRPRGAGARAVCLARHAGRLLLWTWTARAACSSSAFALSSAQLASYDLLFGFTGLLSFGHALYFAIGAYVCNIALTRWEWSFWQALLLTAAVGLAAPLVLGSISLRVTGIAFAMVTLAFAQAGNVRAQEPRQVDGRGRGLGIGFEADIPSAFIGVFNTQNLYWLALGYAAAVFAISAWAVSSSPAASGRRSRTSCVCRYSAYARSGSSCWCSSSRRSSPAGGRGCLPAADRQLVARRDHGELHAGAADHGGAWRHRDALGVDDRRLPLHLPRQPTRRLVGERACAVDLPEVLETPLSEPLFVLGVLFILVVYFPPGASRALRVDGSEAASEVLTVAVQPAMTPEAEDEVEARL